MAGPRILFTAENPRIYAIMREFGAYLEAGSVDVGIRDLVKVRASQINRCVFCLDMHRHEALEHGETEDRLAMLCAWREAPYYSARERAALDLTEAVTLIAEEGVSDALYERVRKHFSAQQYADLLTVINVINAWNRFMIASGATPPVRTTALTP